MEIIVTCPSKLFYKTRGQMVASVVIQFLRSVPQFSQFSILMNIVFTKTSDLLNTLKHQNKGCILIDVSVKSFQSFSPLCR